MDNYSFTFIVAAGLLLATGAVAATFLWATGRKLELTSLPTLLAMATVAMAVGMFGAGVASSTASRLHTQSWLNAQLHAFAEYDQAVQAPAPLTAAQASQLVHTVRAGYADKTNDSDTSCLFSELFQEELKGTVTLEEFIGIQNSDFARVQEQHCRLVTAANDNQVRRASFAARMPFTYRWTSALYGKLVFPSAKAPVKDLAQKMARVGVTLVTKP